MGLVFSLVVFSLVRGIRRRKPPFLSVKVLLKSLTNSIPYSTFGQILKLNTMVNEWINEKLHPITGIRESNKVYVKSTTHSKTQEKYFEDKELLNKVVMQQTVSHIIDYNNV